MAQKRKYWLKMIGAADKEVGDRWVEAWPKLLSEVRFPEEKKPTGIGRDDLMVYYAAGDQRLFAITRAKENGSEATYSAPIEEKRWPWVLAVQTLLLVPQLALAPDWKVLGIPSGSVMQKSHIEITPDQYRTAHQAIVERTANG